MKKILILILMVSVLFITSCDKKDNNIQEVTTTKIVDKVYGTWYYYEKNSKVKDTYIEFNGTGNFKGVTSGYVFHTIDKSKYILDDPNIVLYEENKKVYLECTLKSDDFMQCLKNGTTVMEYHKN